MDKQSNLITNFTQKTQKTYNKIVKYAKKEFSNRGYSNTSIHSIAKKANLSVGCLYKYFSSKDELYYFIINSEQERIKEYINDSIKECKTRREMEKEGLRAWLTYVRDNKGVYKLIWETLFINQEAFDTYYRSFAKSYKYGLSHCDEPLTSDDLLNLSYVLIGISNFLGIRVINAKHRITDEEIDQMVETGFKVITDGIFAK